MSPFEVLGVGIDVDDAGIKRAYARKVREHPPETDAEGFQRVYEAFELLRDEERRDRAARHLQRGAGTADAELLNRLDEADALAGGGRLDEAAQILDALTRRAPQLDAAWESLVGVLERAGGAETAGPAAVAWAAARPAVLEAQLTAARLRTETFDYDQARELLRAAEALAPADRRVYFARAELARTREDWDTALAEISNALALPAEHLSDARLRGARLRVHLERGSTEAAQVELARIEDPAQLTALGALASSLGRIELAAELFGRAKSLDPKRRFTMPLPRKIPFMALKPATREWMLARLAEPPRRDLTFLYLTGAARSPLMLYGGAGLLLSIAAGAWLGVAAVATGLVSAGVMFTGMVQGSYEKFVGFLEPRPLHLVHCTHDEVHVIPLFRIHAMKGEGTVAMLMLENTQPLHFASPDQTALFVDAVLSQRRRLETLASMDLIDTELEREPVDWAA